MGRIDLEERLGYMLQDARIEISGFSKNTYGAKMDELYEKHQSTLIDIEKYYHLENDNMQVLEELAYAFPEYAFHAIEDMRKNKKELTRVDFNMAMVTYIFPMIGKRRESFMDQFADLVVIAWNEKFPQTKIEKSNQESIQSGFKTKLCYITTAVCESMNKPDDCYELSLLRNYRDEYLLQDEEDGKMVVEAYYNMAPTIVKRINKEEDSEVIYHEIWNEYLQPCIHLIEEEKFYETKVVYSDMVEKLAKKYIG